MSTRFTLVRTAMAAALLLGGALSFAPVGAVHAEAPQVKSAPGYYRMMLGDFEVTALSDGTTAMPVVKLLTHITPEQARKDLAADYQFPPYEMSFNAYLINTGSKLVLIDTGAGDNLGPHLGKLAERIKASGYRPEQVDEIYITHMHPDHIGGLSENGKAVFPNAIVRASQRDADFWLSQATMDKAPQDDKAFFKDAQNALAPYIKAGRFKPFNGDVQLSPGIRAISLAGHTPGHTGYMVESQGKKMLVWGDLMHVGAVQFGQPSVTIRFDTDSPEAEAVRKRILAEAARDGYIIAGAHLSFPGLGHVRAAGAGYQWLPVSYVEIH